MWLSTYSVVVVTFRGDGARPRPLDRALFS